MVHGKCCFFVFFLNILSAFIQQEFFPMVTTHLKVSAGISPVMIRPFETTLIWRTIMSMKWCIVSLSLQRVRFETQLPITSVTEHHTKKPWTLPLTLCPLFSLRPWCIRPTTSSWPWAQTSSMRMPTCGTRTWTNWSTTSTPDRLMAAQSTCSIPPPPVTYKNCTVQTSPGNLRWHGKKKQNKHVSKPSNVYIHIKACFFF